MIKYPVIVIECVSFYATQNEERDVYLLAWTDVHGTLLSEKGILGKIIIIANIYIMLTKKGACPCTIYTVTHFNITDNIPGVAVRSQA